MSHNPHVEKEFFDCPPLETLERAWTSTRKRDRNLRFRRPGRLTINGTLVQSHEQFGDSVTVLLKVTNRLTDSPGIWEITYSLTTLMGRGSNLAHETSERKLVASV